MGRKPLDPKIRKRIFERDHYTCQYCGRSAPDVVLEIDHIVPLSKGGGNDPENLRTCCLECNRRKRDYDLTDELREQLYDKARTIIIHHSAVLSQPSSHKADYYTYPAVIDFAADGVGIEFPDIPGCLPCVEAGSSDIPGKIMHNAREALGLHLYNMEDDGDPIPEPSDILTVKHEPNQAVVLVDVYMPPVRERMRNRNVNKMCTVPSWLVKEAEAQDLNFSRTLQEALMDKLGVRRDIRRSRRR